MQRKTTDTRALRQVAIAIVLIAAGSLLLFTMGPAPLA